MEEEPSGKQDLGFGFGDGPHIESGGASAPVEADGAGATTTTGNLFSLSLIYFLNEKVSQVYSTPPSSSPFFHTLETLHTVVKTSSSRTFGAY